MASPKKPPTPTAIMHQPASPRFPPSTPTSNANRKIAIAVDLSDESAYAVKWSVENYLRHGDAVILLHVRPTSVLYGADWGSIDATDTNDEKSKQKLEEDYDNFTSNKSNDLAQPLVDANIPYKIRIVKDHDMKERLCLEIERLGLSAVIMGSRGFGLASRETDGSRLGSVSDYCVRHCVCRYSMRYPGGDDGAEGSARATNKLMEKETEGEDSMFHDASDKGTGIS
ncbi:universal stress protein PHOS32-like [Lycium ferocissimum]|uniref:universal stress protein PHOS32-like n=1 Tax=Lycium ferocissimum TaxID=112874 RepID=UPI0028156C02|nr:universal stress protein PHOS32-like [Lycium ferocissimum]